MASTAAGVAVGSAAGHAITGAASSLFGGSDNNNQSSIDNNQQQAYSPPPPPQQQQQQQQMTCETDARSFTKCLEENSNNISACQWYLDQLKQCQQMAKQY